MSSKYKYIDISVSVVSDGRPETVYSTENAPTVQLPALNEIASNFEGLSEGYLLWGSGKKRAYSYFILDGAEGHPVLTVTLLIDRDVLVAGRPIINLLSAIKTRAIDGDDLSSDLLERLVGENGFSEEALRSSCEAAIDGCGSGVGMRVYASPTELTNILGFPRQKAYEPYRGVLFVPSTVKLFDEATGNIPEITTPVDKALMVVCPEGVEVSEQKVSLSDHLNLTYLSEGFDPVSVKFEVGTTNRYVRINGPALVVNSARHAGVVFRRRIPYSVVTKDGTPIDTFTILIDERTANRTDDGFEITNADFRNGTIKISVSSTNFSTYSQEFTPESLAEATPLEVVLLPDAKEVLLRMDFGDGRIVEETISIEKNAPEYCQLRAGRFHGFRAHRLMGSTPETYNIEVKPTTIVRPQQAPQQPTLPLEEPKEEQTKPVVAPVVEKEVVAEKPTSQYVAPVIEKAPSAIWEEKKHEIKAPEFTNTTRGEKEPEKKKGESIIKKLAIPAEYQKWAKYGAIGLAAILVIWLLAALFSGSSEEATETADSVVVETSQIIAAPGTGAPGLEPQTPVAATTPTADAPAATTTTPAAATDDEKADIEYLNSSKTWSESKIKSEKYKALFTAIKEGDIDALINHDYYAVKGQATNDNAVKAIEFIWLAKGSNQEKGQSEMLKKIGKKPEIDVYDFMDKASRKLPTKEEQNTAARPQR